MGIIRHLTLTKPNTIFGIKLYLAQAYKDCYDYYTDRRRLK